MDAFVMQGQKCSDCKQLYHTKCIQNKGVFTMPCKESGQVSSGVGSRSKHRKTQRGANQSNSTAKTAVQSKFSLTGTSEFTDRTDKIISDAKELQRMQDFIGKKIYKMEIECKQSEVCFHFYFFLFLYTQYFTMVFQCFRWINFSNML